MSDQFHSELSRTEGSVHTGQGDQYNYYYASLTDSRGRSHRSLANDQLLWLLEHFVEPAGFGRARTILDEYRTVFLDGPPGSGRNAAAKMLLHGRCSDAETIHELLVEGDRTDRLDLRSIGEGDLRLLDLSDENEETWAEVRSELTSLRKTVLDHAARLVVVLPAHGSRSLPADLGQYRVEIERPVAMEVVQRYLRVAGVPTSETGSRPKHLLDYLDTQPAMRDLARYVALILEARVKSSEMDFDAWCAEAYGVLNEVDDEVAKFVATLNQGPQLALLLATAMLHGAHADSVHRATVLLLRAAEHPDDESSLLEQAHLHHRLNEIGAKVDTSGRVWLKRLGYDTAIRTHFWKNTPDLREAFGRWVLKTIDVVDLNVEERDRLVAHFSEQCLHERYRQGLADLVAQWAASHTHPRRLRAAAQVLKRGLQDEHGQFFRRKIYDWSMDNSLSHGLRVVLTQICHEVMAVLHPDQALVRLHHLARRESGVTHARGALTDLTLGEARLHRLMLERLARDLMKERPWETDIELFLDYVDPDALMRMEAGTRALIAESALRGQLILGWSVVFVRCPAERWTAQAQEWLRTALVHERFLDVLIAGGAGRMNLLARMYTLARGLPGLLEDRRLLLADLVRQKINIAMQGA
ncbi:hypothetical protein [Sinosporangium siamense]|uniref:Uncharacterized protein n=1 Tax=Sinosporangium siamense TaxID=1367973 RepID=A0A919RBQ4_9ACTN|nr:hypothetical protein [Sinosporangium siamense]GII90985.1 hypothetical protein Ssi02_12160 [Sinosporangium siamense]